MKMLKAKPITTQITPQIIVDSIKNLDINRWVCKQTLTLWELIVDKENN